MHYMNRSARYRTDARKQRVKKQQLGTRIADVSCLQKKIRTAGSLQQDVIWSITVLSLKKSNTKKTHTQFQYNLWGVTFFFAGTLTNQKLSRIHLRGEQSFDTTTSNKRLQLTVSNKSTGDDWLAVKHRFDWCPLGWVWVHFLSLSRCLSDSDADTSPPLY